MAVHTYKPSRFIVMDSEAIAADVVRVRDNAPHLRTAIDTFDYLSSPI
jgi:hypothetical protein